MLTKEEALAQIVTLAKQHAITAHEIERKLAPRRTYKNRDILKKFLAFLGGILIFCGLGIYISEHWGEMNSAARIVITLGTGIALFIFAIVASFDMRYVRALTPLFMLAVLFETVGLFVTVHEFYPQQNDQRYPALAIFVTLFIQQFITFLKNQRTSLMFFSLFFAFASITTAFSIMTIRSDYVAITIGLSLICIGYGIHQSIHRSITPCLYLLGSASFLSGTFDLLQNTNVEMVYLLMSALIIYLSTLTRSKMLLFTGTISMIFYLIYFTHKHFVNSIGWPVSLILLGFVMIGISAVALNLGRKM